jgi:transcriptional regulator with XRE-family HTH domain
MEEITIHVTKLYKILAERGLTQKDLQDLIKTTNEGVSVNAYIINQIVNGKRTNYNLNTLRQIKNALNVSYDDLIDNL